MLLGLGGNMRTNWIRRSGLRLLSSHLVVGLAAIAIAVSGCGDDTTGEQIESTLDGAGGDGGLLDDAAIADALAHVDSGSADIGEDAADDTSDHDAGASDSEGLCIAAGEFGCPCTNNGDCDSSFCLESADGKVCSKTCVEDCPTGFRCRSVNGGGGDLVSLCVPEHARLCDPCKGDGDCNGPQGGGGAVCRDHVVDGALVGRFCATSCKADSDCPGAYSCSKATDGKGHCVLKTGTCGCSKRAVAAKLATTCSTKNAIGACTGQRSCGAKGLTACDAPAAVSETCDGADNDCDGQVDSPTKGLCDDLNSCTADSCTAGKCGHINIDAACDDGDKCTEKDACSKGVCGGAKVVCDDNDVCTDDACDAKTGCFTKPNSAACDDGDVCSVKDACKGGACLPGAATVCDDGNLCTNDACDAKKGCVAKDNKLPCDDNDACTGADTCAAGSCVGAKAICDDGNLCTDDACLPASGCTITTNNDVCSDNNACTVGDVCGGGSCKPGKALACDDGKHCTDDSCDAAKGCVTKDNTLPCDDGTICTVGDVCAAGGCKPGKKLTCADGNGCTNDACDAKKGCLFLPNAASCTDNNACTAGDGCKGGLCKPGKAIGCDDGNGCTDDSCDPAKGCVNKPNSAACSDGSVCTVGDICKLGLGGKPGCAAGPTQECDDGNGCTADSCDAKKGCVHTPNTSPCTDDNACTLKDVCAAGACKPGKARLCDDGKVCTNDACDAKKGCVTTTNKAACADGNACTTTDRCDAGSCKSTGQLSCADGNPCTDDSCDPKKGCVFKANTASCSDNNACTTGDRCVAGVCTPKSPSKCDDANLCTTETCDPKSGCKKTNNSAPCTDGSVCTVGDLCSGGTCKAGAKQACNDGNGCTADSCDAKKGCQHKANTAACSDGNKCTVKDVCGGGKCQPGKALVCNDGKVCTTDSCDASKGCQVSNNTFGCDDGSVCTVGDRCSGGVCKAGKAVVCNDGNVCTDDSCDAKTGCKQINNTKPCPDSDKCTTKETCKGGQCSKAKVSCDDANPCTLNSCASATGCKTTALKDHTTCSSDSSKWCVAAKCVVRCPKAFSGTVSDGSLTAGSDLHYQYSPVTAAKGVIRANWPAQGTGVTGYEVAIGTSKGASNVAGFKLVGKVTSAQLGGLTLKGAWTGTRYFVTVRGVCPGGTKTPAASSNGVQIAEKANFDGTISGLRTPDSQGGHSANWPTNGQHAIYGKHYFETVNIKAGTTVKVQGWGRVQKAGQGISSSSSAVKSPADGWLALYANTVVIDGTITASGRGYGGGGGGGGGSVSTARQGHGGGSGLGGQGGNGEGHSGGGGGGSPYGKGGSGGQGSGGSGNMLGAGSGSTTCGGRAGRNGGDGPVSDIGRSGGTASSGKAGPGGAGEYARGGGNGVHACDSWSGGGGGGYGAGGGGGTQWQGPGTDAGGGGGGGTGGQGGGHTANGGRGAGPFGGKGGGANSSAGGDGGYRAGGGNGDSSKDRILYLGSGGGGGGAGRQETGGGGGSAGGGSILVHGAVSVAIGKTGKLLANGAGAGGGGRDNGGGTTGHRGGRGGGGGLLVEARSVKVMSGAVLSSRGGDGIKSIGGTLKLFYDKYAGSKPSVSLVGRLFDAGKGSYKAP